MEIGIKIRIERIKNGVVDKNAGVPRADPVESQNAIVKCAGGYEGEKLQSISIPRRVTSVMRHPRNAEMAKKGEG